MNNKLVSFMKYLVSGVAGGALAISINAYTKDNKGDFYSYNPSLLEASIKHHASEYLSDSVMYKKVLKKDYKQVNKILDHLSKSKPLFADGARWGIHEDVTLKVLKEAGLKAYDQRSVIKHALISPQEAIKKAKQELLNEIKADVSKGKEKNPLLP